MTGAGIIERGWRSRAAIALIGLAIMMRVLVPAGFMPQVGQGFAITLCTGFGAMPAWVDADGKVHKGQTAPENPSSEHCVFAGFVAALDLPAPGIAALPLLSIAMALPRYSAPAAIGHGLAAPPPPATGPPSNL